MLRVCAIVAKLKQLGRNLDLVNTEVLQLPMGSLPSNAELMMAELQKPIAVFACAHVVV